MGLDERNEDGQDFEENALIKARAAFSKTNLPTLADDSGLCVDALNNFTGLASKRFADAAGSYDKATSMLSVCLESKKNAHFVTCVAFIFIQYNKVIEKTFIGGVTGQIYLFRQRL